VLKHSFDGTPFTVGVEEELMIVDAKSMNLAHGIEQILAALPDDAGVRVKPELMQSVLEVATEPCPDVETAGQQLAALRARVAEVGGPHGYAIGAAGTHPFARWDEQLIVERPRYQELAEELGYVALREMIFGTHVHVGVDGADKAIYIADGIRRYLPLMLALSANSPFWQGRRTGMASSRTPVFRGFPRVGIPPYYGSWEIYCHRVELMMRSGAIEDYTYLWWDVRPHPNLGTVEVRVFDQQTRLQDTIALAALVQALVHRLAAEFEEGIPSIEHPTELIDDNKVRAAIRGLDGDLVDFDKGRRASAREMLADLLAGLREHAQELGCETELGWADELLEGGPEARAQAAEYERNEDLESVVRWLVAGTSAELDAQVRKT
jgi:carboxylate-amine ligase